MQGQYEDQETGLYYNRYRYFDTNISAYISQDPIRLNAGTNLYYYCLNSIMWADPLGLDQCPSSFIKNDSKPKYSPDPEKWYKKGGTITTDENNIWTYHDWEGNSVSYPNGYPDFKSANMVKQEISIDKFESYPKDFLKADNLAPNGPKLDTSTWHHNEDLETMQEINKKIHNRFTHLGGMSKSKK